MRWEESGGRVDLYLAEPGGSYVGFLLALPGAGSSADLGRASKHRSGGLAFRIGLFAPGACDDVVGGLALLHEVHRTLSEHLRRATLQEDDSCVAGRGGELAQERERLIVDCLIFLAPVAGVDDGHAARCEVGELVSRALERGEGRAAGPALKFIARVGIEQRFCNKLSSPGTSVFNVAWVLAQPPLGIPVHPDGPAAWPLPYNSDNDGWNATRNTG